MGYRNSPTEFLRALTPIVESARRVVSTSSQLLFYMDDLILISKYSKTHVENLGRVFAVFERDSWHMRPHKCTYMQSEFKFVEYQLSGQRWALLDGQICIF